VDVSVVAASQRSTHDAVVEKCKVNPAIRDEKIFYPKFAGMALRFVFRGSVEPRTSCVLAFTDTLPIKKQREAVEKTFKLTCRADLHNLPLTSTTTRGRAIAGCRSSITAAGQFTESGRTRTFGPTTNCGHGWRSPSSRSSDAAIKSPTIESSWG
jgi:hypothetical protein